ncbi:MAG: MerR family transcriptional regulator [Lachnospiraceae bacterium]|nr:MerR family transcriptional regulator [Lachnospiraceae bacterium]
MEQMITLHELCDTVGVSRRAVQGYEKEGLVEASDRNKFGYLLYDEKAQLRIAQIKLYQQFGFKVKEIKELLDAPRAVVKAALEDQVIHMEEEQVKIEALIRRAYELIDALQKEEP